jgi:hypothetical protein
MRVRAAAAGQLELSGADPLPGRPVRVRGGQHQYSHAWPARTRGSVAVSPSAAPAPGAGRSRMRVSWRTAHADRFKENKLLPASLDSANSSEIIPFLHTRSGEGDKGQNRHKASIQRFNPGTKKSNQQMPDDFLNE